MNRILQKMFPLLLFLFLFVPSKAIVLLGNELSWECDPNDPCSIIMTYTLWEDCPIVGVPDYPDLQWICNSGSGVQPTLQNGWVPVSNSRIENVCPTAKTLCDPVPGPNPAHGAVQIRYQARFNKCGPILGTLCPNMTILWAYNRWSAQVTSLNNPQSQFVAGTSTISMEALTCNSSPQFAIPPMVEICNDQPSIFSIAAVDPDGDEIRYSMKPCSSAAGSTLPHTFSLADYNTAGGYSPASPLGPNWDVDLDIETGAITFTPLNGGASVTGVICVEVEEIRDGQVIGSTIRNFAVHTEPCTQDIPTLSGINNTTNFRAEACVGQQLCFDVHSSDPNTNDILTITNLLSLAGVTLTTGSGSQPISQVCWTPTAADVGTHLVVLQVEDNECPVPGRQQLTYTITVDSLCDPCEGVVQEAAFTYTTSLLDLTVQNQSTGSGITFVGWLWGDGTLPTFPTTNFNDPITHTYTEPGTYEVCLWIGTPTPDNSDLCIETICQMVTVYETVCDTVQQSASFDHITNLLDLTVDNTSSGNSVTFTRYQWGDGTPDQLYSGNHPSPVTHSYAIPGTYTVCLVLETYVGNLCCHETICKEITVTTPPCEGHTANFQYYATLDPCTYWFNDTSFPSSDSTYWQFSNDTIVRRGSPLTYTFPGTGTYTLTMRSLYHPSYDSTVCCFATKTRTFNVYCGEGKENKRADNVTYQEQTNSVKVEIGSTFDVERPLTVAVYDLKGQLLLRKVHQGSATLELDLMRVSAGIYLVRIAQDDQQRTVKFLKY